MDGKYLFRSIENIIYIIYIIIFITNKQVDLNIRFLII